MYFICHSCCKKVAEDAEQFVFQFSLCSVLKLKMKLNFEYSSTTAVNSYGEWENEYRWSNSKNFCNSFLSLHMLTERACKRGAGQKRLEYTMAQKMRNKAAENSPAIYKSKLTEALNFQPQAKDAHNYLKISTHQKQCGQGCEQEFNEISHILRMISVA